MVQLSDSIPVKQTVPPGRAARRVSFKTLAPTSSAAPSAPAGGDVAEPERVGLEVMPIDSVTLSDVHGP